MPFLWKIIVTITLLYYVEGNFGSAPVIDGPAELVIEAGKNFALTCRSDGETKWSYPVHEETETIFEEEQSADKNILKVTNPHYLNTGFYKCGKEGHPPAAIYVYISDPENLLVADTGLLWSSAYQGDNITIPCRPTSPNVNVTLSTSNGIVYALPNGYDPKTGFLLTNLAVTDSGNLICSASIDNFETEDVVQFHLIIHSRTDILPVPLIQSDELGVVQIGENLTMACEVVVERGLSFTLNWVLPDNRELNDRIKLSQTIRKQESDVDNITWRKELKIQRVVKEDEGNYVCVITGMHHRNESTSHFLNIHSPGDTFLNITVEADCIEERDGASSARWVGTISSHPDATLKWVDSSGRDISLVSIPGKYKITRKGKRFMLEILNITPEDAGSYAIIVTNDVKNETKHLKLDVRSTPNILMDELDLFEVNREKNITCRVLGFPTPKTVWLFKKCDLLIDRNCDDADEVPVSGDLIEEYHLDNKIQSILKWNMTSPGELICEASNEEGDGRALISLKITDVPEGFSIKIPDEIVEGDDVIFVCRANSYTYTDQLQWYYAPNETSIHLVIEETEQITFEKSQGSYSTEVKLVMKKVTKENSGLYACLATLRDGGMDDHSFNITILDPQKPTIITTNLNQTIVTVDKLEPIEWHCYVEGVPKPIVRWFHNGVPIVITNSSELVLHNSNQTLILSRLSPQDEGEYSCHVFNKFGYTSAEITLQILSKVRIPFYLLPVLILAAILLSAFIAFLFWRLCKEKKRRKALSLVGLKNFRDGDIEAINPALTLQEQAALLPYHSKWEFPRNRLHLGKQLGAGAFGVVHKAEAKGIIPNEPTTTVAVKMVQRHSDSAMIRDLASELKIMAHLGRHAHVVNLLGAVTTKLAERELLIIVEFCQFGNVRNYILSNRSRFVDQLNPITGELDLNRARIIGYDRNRFQFPNIPFARSVESEQFSGASHNTESTLVYSQSPGVLSGDYEPEEILPLSTSVLIGWSFQIARGMEWLASRKVLHGDLAARNILLSEGNIVKICDFGLARSIYSNPEYQKTEKIPLPIKWMAIESVRSAIFSTQSDVWSYGIVLWELFGLARTPYPGIENRNMLKMLTDGYRMEKPEFAPKKLYDLMRECWNEEPSKRPSFTDLSCKLGVLLEDSEREHYLELEEQYREKNEPQDHDYLSMIRAPNFEEGVTYVNVPPSPGYMEMESENHELKPMLQPSPEEDYLKPRDAPFSPSAVSNPSYEVTLPKSTPEKTYGKLGKSSVRDNINLFESFRKKH